MFISGALLSIVRNKTSQFLLAKPQEKPPTFLQIVFSKHKSKLLPKVNKRWKSIGHNSKPSEPMYKNQNWCKQGSSPCFASSP